MAKHIADQVLRSNPALARIHSNTSVRRIMEQQARQQLAQRENSDLDEIPEENDLLM